MTTANVKPDWIAIDRRSLQAWAMQGATVLQHRALAPQATGFDWSTISDWIAAGATDVVLCGLASDRVPVPAKPAELPPARGAFSNDDSVRLWSLPGLQQRSPADVMDGAETTIAGFLSLNPNWDGVICLPGHPTHWVQISADEVVSFQSFLSLELFTAVSGGESVGAADADAIADAMSRPERMAQHLNAARAAHVSGDHSADDMRRKMLGTLLGAELAAARPYWLGQQIALIGPPEWTGAYQTALQTQAALVTCADDQRMTLAGLTAAWRRLPGT